ncbi:MAG: hypothetical protein WDZ29_07115 [Balneolaceae bacterium]
MKTLLTILFTGIVTISALEAQSIEVHTDGETSQSELYTYRLGNSTITFEETGLQMNGLEEVVRISDIATWSISPNGTYTVAIQHTNPLSLHILRSSDGSKWQTELTYFKTDDSTLGLYVFNSGRVVTRDNVSNFTFFQPDGSIDFTYSNQSGSQYGERPSRLAADSNGRTVVLYNPIINHGFTNGSRARIIHNEEEFVDLLENDRLTINRVRVSDDGERVAIGLEEEGEVQNVQLFDRDGLLIQTLEPSLPSIEDLRFSEDRRYLTVRSRNRVVVYLIGDGELIGSTSFRNEIQFANYVPEEEQLIALTGNLGERNRVNSVDIYSVHFGERSLASTSVSMPLSISMPERVNVQHTGEGQFYLAGLNRMLIVETNF